MTVLPMLPEYQWKIHQRDENPLLAMGTAWIFPISKHLSVIVTNRFNDQMCDRWLILEEHSDPNPCTGRKVYSFVDHKPMQSIALITARQYAWAIWRKDIAFPETPF